MQEYGAGNKSRWAKKHDKTRFRIHAVDKASQLIECHGKDQARKIAENSVVGIQNSVGQGALGCGLTSKDVQRTLGFWRSVAGYLNRDVKPAPGRQS